MSRGPSAPTLDPLKASQLRSDDMTFPYGIQDEDDLISDILAELEAMGNDDAAPTQTPEPVQPKPEPKGFGFQIPDFDDPDVIREEIKLTRYDKARAKLRALEEKRTALPADCAPAKIAVIEKQIESAREAVKAAEGDVARLRDGIDEWRAGAGRDEYNASRRARSEPNADLKDMTEEQKTRRKLDQTADSKFVSRRRAAGMPEDQIQAELIVAIEKRAAKRAAKAQEEAGEAEMRADPRHGIF
ncbi:hypothetical protein DFO80_12017 [Rhodobacter sp. 140A]|nr:hypothetical protein DFO80_12017 [Rhodobacter sp. 140A]